MSRFGIGVGGVNAAQDKPAALTTQDLSGVHDFDLLLANGASTAAA